MNDFKTIEYSMFPGDSDCLFIKRFKERGLAILLDEAVSTPRACIVAPAELSTPALVNQLISFSGGLIFVALSPERCRAFMLNRMAKPRALVCMEASGPDEVSSIPGLCESVEAREGVTTGISAFDRAATIAVLGERQPLPRKLVKPGHIFPCEVREGGVLVRNALPEGALDLVRLGGFSDAAVFVDLLDEQGAILSKAAVEGIAREREMPIITLEEIIRYRLETEQLVYRVAEAKLPTGIGGEMRAILYKSKLHGGEHLALLKGEIHPEQPVLVRVQPEFTFGDVFGGDNPASRKQIEASLKAIGERGSGVLVYLRRPRSGQLKEQISSWERSVREKPAVMMREYGLGAQILRDLGVHKVELLTNSKKNLVGLKPFGIEIVSQLPIAAYEVCK